MIKKTEKEITKYWKNDSPLVSVICMVYNHARYVADALDGFLQQETDFPFEVIIHDDASVDGSPDVIREYEKNFPNIIKPIYEKTNLYSRDTALLRDVVYRELKGKYIAICEGDDYWCDSHKLKKMVDFLEVNNNYSACAHNTILMNLVSRKQKRKTMFSDKDCDLNLRDILDGNDCHTSSVVCRREYFLNRPAFCFAQPGVGDYPLKVFLAMMGPVKRFGKVMSVYRFGTPNSWTLRTIGNAGKIVQNSINAMRMLCMANEWSTYNFNDVFRPVILRTLYNNFMKIGRFDVVKGEPYASFWNSESAFAQAKYYLRSLKYAYCLSNKDELMNQMKEIDSIINKK